MEVIEDGEIIEKKVPVSKASKEWLKSTGGLSSNIRFDLLEGDPKRIFEQCIEIMKYTSKVHTFEAKHIIEILSGRKGKRFFATYGELYNLKNNTIDHDEELENTGLEGYVWDNNSETLIPMNRQENQYLTLKYAKKEQYYQAKAVMMKSYYIKENIKFEIVKAYRRTQKAKEVLEKQLSVIKPGAVRIGIEKELDAVIQCQPTIRLRYVERIDRLEDVYKQFKKATFKKYMGLKLRKKDKMIVDNMNTDQKQFYNSTRGLLQIKKTA